MSGGAHEIRRESGGLLCLGTVGRPPKIAVPGRATPSLVARKASLLRLLGPCLPAETALDVFSDEASLILAFTDFVRRVDPDILVGFEVQYSSWGYLISRARFLGEVQTEGVSGKSALFSLLHLERELSRLPRESSRLDSSLAKMTDAAGGADVGGVTDDSAAAIAFLEEKESGWGLGGRVILNVWKRCRVCIFFSSSCLSLF